MNATTIVDMVLDYLNIEVINTVEEDLSSVWDISLDTYNELIKLVEQELKD